MVIRSTGALESKTLSELAEIYNSVPGIASIKKFRDKETGIRRTLEALSNSQSKIKGTKKRKNVRVLRGTSIPLKPQGQDHGRRVGKMNYPYKGNIPPHRPNTKRALTIQMLTSGGATVAEIMVETGWDERVAREGIRILHSRMGYGMKELDNGKIILLTEPDQHVE